MTSISDASGRPQLTIAKDTTLKISWGVLLGILVYAGVGTWQFFEMRQIDRDRVTRLELEISRNIDNLKSDLNYTDKTLTGYARRYDKLDDGIQSVQILRHRLDQIDIAATNQERRMVAHETRMEEVQRKTAELTVVVDYMLRASPTSPRKRSGVYGTPLWGSLVGYYR